MAYLLLYQLIKCSADTVGAVAFGTAGAAGSAITWWRGELVSMGERGGRGVCEVASSLGSAFVGSLHARSIIS